MTYFIEDIIQFVQLESKKNVKTKVLTYSEKKRAQLACLLIQNPDIYIMEEPDQNLDVESKHIFLSVLHKLRMDGKTVFILTGQLESGITFADKTYRLDDQGLDFTQTEVEKEEKVVQPIRFEKIPTKVNEKIVLFDPLEIDYIESTEGYHMDEK